MLLQSAISEKNFNKQAQYIYGISCNTLSCPWTHFTKDKAYEHMEAILRNCTNNNTVICVEYNDLDNRVDRIFCTNGKIYELIQLRIEY